jgi:hypothetical protein
MMKMFWIGIWYIKNIIIIIFCIFFIEQKLLLSFTTVLYLLSWEPPVLSSLEYNWNHTAVLSESSDQWFEKRIDGYQPNPIPTQHWFRPKGVG